MSNFLGERYDFKSALISVGTSTHSSQPFALRDCKRVTVLIEAQAGLSSVLSTLVSGATFKVVGGVASNEVSAMTAITGLQTIMGMTTQGQLNNWEVIAIAAHGTLATGISLTIDNTTFTSNPNSCVADKAYLTSACSAAIHAIASNIATWCTHLETFGLVTAGNATATAVIYVRRKDYGPGMAQGIDAAVTAQAQSSDIVYVQGIKQQAMIEFTPNDILATNSSYTHFGIQFQQVGTILHGAAQVIREVGYNPGSSNLTRVTL